MRKKVGIVVPTLGMRPDYLTQCLESIRAAGSAHICLVAPRSFASSKLIESGLADQFVVDSGKGLSEAINEGISALPEHIEYVNWLGDDDHLAQGALQLATDALDSDKSAVLVFGSCDYLDPAGQKIWTNKSGPWAAPLLHFGPDLIPQPGALFRRNDFISVGGLNNAYDWAFDFDLLLKLKKIGKLKFLNATLASFRWHPTSLSVEYRNKSVSEASQVRISHLPKALKPLAWLWEFPVKKATLVAGSRITSKAKRLAK